ncbi:MAG TPA: hypothetical protein VFK19_07235 [Sphingomicrobium sp.]|nr:hypothetical protein [Sphingomicrobium sp.]
MLVNHTSWKLEATHSPYLKHLLIAAFAVLAAGPAFAAPVPAPDAQADDWKPKVATSIPADIEAAVAKCKPVEKPTRFGDVFCLIGPIERAPIRALLEDKTKIKILVARSPGGDTKAARELGLRVRYDASKVVINGVCFSSCANYIVPSGKLSLWVLANSVIALHGSPPRDFFGYADTRLIAAHMTKTQLAKDMSVFWKWEREFPAYVDDEIVPEVRFFAIIGVPEAYITHFFDAEREIRREGDKCPLPKGFLIIVDKDYLNAFNIWPKYFWQPESDKQYADLLTYSKKDYTMVKGFSRFPFWTVEGGFFPDGACHIGTP